MDQATAESLHLLSIQTDPRLESNPRNACAGMDLRDFFVGVRLISQLFFTFLMVDAPNP